MMRIRALVLSIALVGVVMGSQQTSVRAQIVRTVPAKCTTTGYSQNCGGCVTIREVGTFTIKVAHTKIVLKGKDSPDTAETKVCASKIATPVASVGGIGIRVTANGPFGTLKVKAKALYSYNKKTGRLKKVKSITKPGIYQVVL